MIYSDIAIIAFSVAVMVDLFIFRTSMLTRPAFWTSYAIILPFQFLTNWWLTSRNIVMYDPNAIVGVRFFSAPAEDVLFGFALFIPAGTLAWPAGWAFLILFVNTAAMSPYLVELARAMASLKSLAFTRLITGPKISSW